MRETQRVCLCVYFHYRTRRSCRRNIIRLLCGNVSLKINVFLLRRCTFIPPNLVTRKRKKKMCRRKNAFNATIEFTRNRGNEPSTARNTNVRSHSHHIVGKYNNLSLEHLKTVTNCESMPTHVYQKTTNCLFVRGNIIYFFLLIVSIARSPSTSLYHVRKRSHNLRHLPPHRACSFSRMIASITEGISSLAISTRKTPRSFARSIAIQHSSVDVLEICVLAPLEKLLLQVSTARAVSGTWTNCTFSLGHLLLP